MSDPMKTHRQKTGLSSLIQFAGLAVSIPLILTGHWRIGLVILILSFGAAAVVNYS